MEEIPKPDDLSSASPSSSSSSHADAGKSDVQQQQRISVSSDHMYTSSDKIDSFVIDMDAFSSGINIDTTTNSNANSRNKRSLSRKGSQRGGDRKVNGNIPTILHDMDAASAAIFSPRGPCTPEKAMAMAVGSSDHLMSPHTSSSYHQIANTASNITTTTESKSISRRESSRRPSLWTLDPKRFKHGNNVADILHSHYPLSKMQMRSLEAVN